MAYLTLLEGEKFAKIFMTPQRLESLHFSLTRHYKKK